MMCSNYRPVASTTDHTLVRVNSNGKKEPVSTVAVDACATLRMFFTAECLSALVTVLVSQYLVLTPAVISGYLWCLLFSSAVFSVHFDVNFLPAYSTINCRFCSLEHSILLLLLMALHTSITGSTRLAGQSGGVWDWGRCRGVALRRKGT